MDSLNIAREWIRTSPADCRRDVERLGLRRATSYNVGLARERVAAGDTRWRRITAAAMRTALSELTITTR